MIKESSGKKCCCIANWRSDECGKRGCGDTDGRVPVTSSRYSINTFQLPIETAWHPWYTNREVGGYVEAYKGLVLATVRGAGHTVPSYQPERALTMIASFLQGELPLSGTY
ncbi:hypothetical protein IFM89_032575 [Coptis chinensis]|uniref:Uncharacterized protein n=1 Tax=Coptis chinensis TaxID=261450 RepID=A0A835IS89_9MAGN|nr:hypothetical protein IFM89_032575 [Coptis chinensis]